MIEGKGEEISKEVIEDIFLYGWPNPLEDVAECAGKRLGENLIKIGVALIREGENEDTELLGCIELIADGITFKGNEYITCAECGEECRCYGVEELPVCPICAAGIFGEN